MAQTRHCHNDVKQDSDQSDLSFRQIVRGKVTWTVRADAEHIAFDGQAPHLLNWLKSGIASKIKSGPHRSVYRLSIAGKSFFMKHFRVPGLRSRLSQWLRNSKGRREWDMLRWAKQQGIPTIEPVGLGEARSGGQIRDNFLITEGLENVMPLPEFGLELARDYSKTESEPTRRHMSRSLAQLIARLHQSGLQHRDLHSGNILVSVSDDARPTLRIIDLDAARRRKMTWNRSRPDIVLLAMSCMAFSNRADRLRFLNEYISCRPELELDKREAARDLSAGVRTKARNSFWKRSWRCLFNNRRFYYEDHGRCHGWAITELSQTLFNSLLRRPDAPIKQSLDKVKDSVSSTVVQLTLPLDGQHVSVMYKRFQCVNSLDPMRALLHRSPALRAWFAGYTLILRRIPTPRPIAVIQKTPFALPRQNYLITEMIEGAVSLRSFLADVFPKLGPSQKVAFRRDLALRLGTLLRRLHDNQISHRDLKSANILVCPLQESTMGISWDQYDLMLIDLDAVQIWRRLPDKKRVQNIARVFVSFDSVISLYQSDCLRFLHAYLSPRVKRSEIRSLWKKIGSRAVEKVNQNQERGRTVT